MKINFIDLQRQYQKHKEELDAALGKIMADAAFIMGPPVFELEKKLADFTGATHALSCASGTDALLLALLAYDIQPGDEIITTPFTFIATAEVIALLKAKPVFVDIRSDTFNIDFSKMKRAITKKTKGIIPVDIFGQCADYAEINPLAREHNLFVVEDAAQSFGAGYKGKKAGSLGDIGCTSFFPAKPLGCYGDGGMVFTNDPRMAEIMTSLRVHGQGDDKYNNVRIGINGRLDTLQAAVLLIKLADFPGEIATRNKIADYYSKNLREPVMTPLILKHNVSAYAQYAIRVPDRTALQKHLKERNIPTAIYYPKPLHLQKAFDYLGYRPGAFPVAEAICNDILAIPMHPYLQKNEQELIVESINAFYKKG